MHPLNLSTTFITFFAVVGPPKVMLTFAQLSRRHPEAAMRQLTLVSSLVAAVVGAVMAYSADFLTSLFHVTDQSLQLAGGVVFFLYAVALVLGIHLGGGDDDEQLANPLAEGVRELLLPYVASPLAISAVLVESLEEDTWSWHSTVAGMYVAVIAIDCVSVLVLAPLLRRFPATSLQVISRLLGLLLAAVGVEVFLRGLTALGVHIADSR